MLDGTVHDTKRNAQKMLGHPGTPIAAWGCVEKRFTRQVGRAGGEVTGFERRVYTSGGDDASSAYLFRACNDRMTWGVTHDALGMNLPPIAGGWQLEREFALGVREAMPIQATPEPVLRGLYADGYFVGREHSNPPGTSQ